MKSRKNLLQKNTNTMSIFSLQCCASLTTMKIFARHMKRPWSKAGKRLMWQNSNLTFQNSDGNSITPTAVYHRLLSSKCYNNECVGILWNKSTLCKRFYSAITSDRTCWKCTEPLLDHKMATDHPADVFHCPRCDVLQPPTEHLNYFQLLGFETDYNVDTKHLTSKYRKIQSRLHPDKAARLSQVWQWLKWLTSHWFLHS